MSDLCSECPCPQITCILRLILKVTSHNAFMQFFGWICFYLLSLCRSRKKSVMVDLDINKVGKNFSWFLDIVKLDIKDRPTICTIQDLKSEEETELLNSSHSG